MTYPSTSPQARYEAIAGQTEFDGTFKIFTNDGVNVYLTPAGETPDEINDKLTLDVDYTIDIDNDTFDMTLLSPAEAGDIITMFLDEAYQKLQDLSEGGPYFSAIVNDILDKITALTSQNNAILKARGLTYSEVENIQSPGQTTIPLLEPHQIWKADASKNIQAVTPEEDPDSSTLRSEIENRSQSAPGTDVTGSWIGEFGGAQSLTQALNDLSDKNRYAVTTGSSTAYEATISRLSQYYNGFTAELKMHVTNGASPTLNFNLIGAIPMADQDGTPLSGGECLLNSFHRVTYIDGQFRTYTTVNPASSEVLWNYRTTGQKVYQDTGSDPTRNIGVTKGMCADSTNQVYIKLLADRYKQTNAPFAEGNGQGGMPPVLLLPSPPPVLAAGDYNTFVLLKTFVDTGTYPTFNAPVGSVEVGYDTAPDGANLLAYAAPRGYTYFRYMGNRYISATGIITDAVTNGTLIMFDRAQIVRAMSPVTGDLTPVDLVYTPTGRKVIPIISCRTASAGGAFGDITLGTPLTHVVELDDRTISNIQYIGQPGSGANAELIGARNYPITNLNREIVFRLKAGASQLQIAVLGYYDFIND